MAAKIQKSSDLDEIWFPNRLWWCEFIAIVGCYGGHFESKMATKIQKSSDLEEIWFPSRLWCCELISIVGLLCWPFCQWSPISMKIDIYEYYEASNWLVPWILIWGSFMDFCVCIQTQSNLVNIIIIIIIPLLFLSLNFSDQILRDWLSDLY
jgi:hypothetical protein